MSPSHGLRKTRPSLGGDDKTSTVVASLRHEIAFGRLKPRERLVEEEISERFSVGRHVVRSALEELDRLGFVRRRPNRGAVVSDYSTGEVDELYEMRTLLQREAAVRILLPSPLDLVEQLTEINARYLQYSEAGELDLASAANDLFHQTVFGACNNRYLAESIQEYWIKTAAIHSYAIASPVLSKKSRDEHSGIIDAMARGDRPLLVRLCIEHMLPALEAYKAAHGGWLNKNLTR